MGSDPVGRFGSALPSIFEFVELFKNRLLSNPIGDVVVGSGFVLQGTRQSENGYENNNHHEISDANKGM
jgi:hypothetical protein